MAKKFSELRDKMSAASQARSEKTYTELCEEYERMDAHFLLIERIWTRLVSFAEIIEKHAPSLESDFLSFCGQVTRNQDQIVDFGEVIDPDIPFMSIKVTYNRRGRRKSIAFQLGVPKQDEAQTTDVGKGTPE